MLLNAFHPAGRIVFRYSCVILAFVRDRRVSTSVLVDVVYVLGGDVAMAANAQPMCDAETAERLLAAAALMGIARQIMHEIVVTNGLPIEQARRLAAEAAAAAGWISGEDGGTEWLRAG
ncbi:hypothetical protein JJ691_26310 [Kutzneria sp. CA-103260]|nr:hypothetical protein JJ691_26310 [Kutzneria sp. CA-103260]